MDKIGELFIVSTPIGNLNDITYRAVEVLNSVDIIAAEDTRHSGILLSHWGITTKTTAFHDHNEKDKAERLIGWLKEGKNIALISDAGTPLISDPGYAIVNLCREQDIRVTPIPGACAAIAALSCSGLPTDNFTFMGFVPVKQQAKQNFLQKIDAISGTAICYESPRRIVDTVEAIIEHLGLDTPVVLAKELTKTFETFHTGTVAELLQWLQADPVHQKGEMVLMIGNQPKVDVGVPQPAIELLTLLGKELPPKKAAAIVASHYDLKKNDLYKIGLAMQQRD